MAQNEAMTSSHPANRRRYTRYRFKTDLTYKSLRNGSVLFSGQGSTVDMSAGGILLRLDRVPDPGARVELSLAWPGLLYGSPQVRLMVVGRVLRAEGVCAAVRIVQHEFQVTGSMALPPAPPRARGRRLEVA